MSSTAKPLCVDDVRPRLKVLRQARKNRWLVCHQDSPEGDAIPAKSGKSKAKINRIIGVAAIIVNQEDRVLVGKRMGSHGAGTWALPGGHIDDTKHEADQAADAEVEDLTTRDPLAVESEAKTAWREVLEETGLEIDESSVKNVHTTWDHFEENKPGFQYYNTFFVTCKTTDPNPKPTNEEEDKCSEWRFMSWGELSKIWEGYPVVQDEDDGPDAEAAKKVDAALPEGEKKEKLFLPLAKLVRDYPDLQSLRSRNEV